jgi:hypothetical protein
MSKISDRVKRFFEEYEKATNVTDVEMLSSQYADTFMFGGLQGVQSIKKEDFLRVIPKRKGFFTSVGLKTTKLVSLEESRLDDRYFMIKACWKMRFEKDLHKPVEDEIFATYVIFLENNSLRIVFQIDHQDLQTRVQELGLM